MATSDIEADEEIEMSTPAPDTARDGRILERLRALLGLHGWSARVAARRRERELADARAGIAGA